jgi:hypothetical protein
MNINLKKLATEEMILDDQRDEEINELNRKISYLISFLVNNTSTMCPELLYKTGCNNLDTCKKDKFLRICCWNRYAEQTIELNQT